MKYRIISRTLVLALVASGVCQTSTPPGEHSLSKELKAIVDWTIAKPVPAQLIRIQHCKDGTRRNPHSIVCALSYPRLASEHSQTSADTIPPVREIATRVNSVLLKNGWRKCTPDQGDGDYYNNEGPWMMSTYIKDKSLLQLNVSYSQGVGYQIAIQYECEPPLSKPTSK
jgi:hypothetical protein